MHYRVASGSDRISKLSDILLCSEILPKLSLTDAIRCSLVSHRWRFLWRRMPHLNFSSHDFTHSFKRSIHRSDCRKYVEERHLEGIVDNVLLFHSASLQSFQIAACLDACKAHKLRQWFHYAALRGVKCIVLRNFPSLGNIGDGLEGVPFVLELPISVFACKSLTSLELACLTFVKIPIGFNGFPLLKTCYLDHVHLNDYTLQQFVRLCPLLENLVLHSCDELRNVKICAPNLSSLDIGFCQYIMTLKLECPKFIEIKLLHNFDLCLAAENYFQHPAPEFTLLERISAAESVKKIKLFNFREVFLIPPSVTVLGLFPLLEELTIHGECFEEMVNLRKSTLFVPLPNLKKVDLHLVLEMGEKEVVFVGFLLRNSPSLNVITLSLPFCPKNIHDQMFMNQVLDLEKAYPEVKLLTTIRKGSPDGVCQRNSDFGKRIYAGYL